MIALRTGTEVHGYTMGVFNPITSQTHWILVNATPQFRLGEEKPWQVFATFDDITQRVLFEQQFKAATQRLDIAFSKTGLSWMQWYPLSDRVIIADTLSHHLGLTTHNTELSLQSWYELIHPQDRALVVQEMQTLAQGSNTSYCLHYRMRHHEGHYVQLCDNSEIIADTQSPAPCILATIQLQQITP